ncbi:MAG: 50S ribosomal protein L1 [Eggerthellaceae bacterium]|nr:50S ribosomal protein L1 [Eggerthellaceae bacterium]
MAKKSKNYRAAVEKIGDATYAPLEAFEMLKEVASAKFDETVEAHFRLGIDTRKADQNLRGTVALPNGSGKTVRVAVFAEGDPARAAEEAGADIVGSDDLVADIQAGEINFDAAVATPDQMSKVGRLGKILGPRNLMPNPKLGTVTTDVAKAVADLKGGRVEYRADRFGIAHVIIGKTSFTAEQLAQNYGVVYDEILRMKPSTAKGKYVKSITVASTMSPGVPVDSAVQRDYDVKGQGATEE